jgi:hypothetical protein
MRRPLWIAGMSLALAGMTGGMAAALPVCPLGVPLIFRAGVPDEFAGAEEATSRGAALEAAFPTAAWKDFNDAAPNRFVGQTFTGLPDGITKAELVLRVKPHADLPFNDAVDLGLLPASQFAASFRFANLPEAHGSWDPALNGATTFTLALGVTYQALLGQMSSQHTLDVLVQDDSAVDFMELRVWVCPPPVAASGLPNQAVGSAQLTADGQGGLQVSGVGAAGGDGVKIQVGNASLVGVALAGLENAPVGTFVDLQADSPGPTVAGRLQRDPNSWSFVPDVVALGEPAAQVQVYDADNRLVGSFADGSGIVHFDSPPAAISVGHAGVGPFGPVSSGPGPHPGPGPNVFCLPGQTLFFSCGDKCPWSTCDQNDPFQKAACDCIHNCAKNTPSSIDQHCQGNSPYGLCFDAPQPFQSGPRALNGNCLFWDFPSYGNNPLVNFQITSNAGFGVTREQLGVGGFAASLLGDAKVDASVAGLRFSDFGAGSGVAFATQHAGSAHVLFGPIDPSRAATNAALQADVTGSLDGTPDQPLGTFRATQGAGSASLLMVASFPALGAATQRVEVYDQGRPVTVVTGSSGTLTHQAFNIVVVWPVALDALSGGGFGLTWSAAGRFTLPTGETADGDELRVIPEPSAFITIDNISGLALRPSGLPELTISDVRAASCAPTLSSQPADVTTAAGRPAVFSVAAASASPLTFRWRRNGVDLADGPRTAGSATASLTLSPTILALGGSYDVVMSNACGSTVSTPAAYTPGVALRNLLLALLGDVQSLVQAGTLSAPQGASLSRSLLRAEGFLRAGALQAAANRMDVFVARVNAFVHAGALSSSQGTALTSAATTLRGRLVD